jgi:ATP/maltotriose-dependent transcriptional regulator MalT
LSADSAEEKERFVSSIIKALTNDGKHGRSTILARALIFRARLYVSKKQLFEAEKDAIEALHILDTLEKRLIYQATLVMADVFELQGNIGEAVNLLQDLATTDRSMRSKLLQEVDRLRKIMVT